MSKKRKVHIPALPGMLEEYTRSRTLEYHRYSPYHMRLIDDGFTVVDCWTTGKYWIMQTNYSELTDEPTVERGGEKGLLPTGELELYLFLDTIFFVTNT